MHLATTGLSDQLSIGALIVSVISLLFSIYIFRTTRRDLHRQQLMNSVPSVDFWLNYPKESGHYLIANAQNLHTSVAITDLQLNLKLSIRDGARTLSVEEKLTIQSIPCNQTKTASFFSAGEQIHELFSAMGNTDGIIGKTGTVKLSYSFQPAALSIPRQSGLVNFDLTLRTFSGEHWLHSNRVP